jgi:hypothetical protein
MGEDRWKRIALDYKATGRWVRGRSRDTGKGIFEAGTGIELPYA